MAEFNMRQYNKMLSVVNGLSENPTVRELGSAISSLEFLLSQIQNSKWTVEFRRQWWILEEVYAVLLSQKRSRLNDEELNLLRKVQLQMKELLDFRINHPEAIME